MACLPVAGLFFFSQHLYSPPPPSASLSTFPHPILLSLPSLFPCSLPPPTFSTWILYLPPFLLPCLSPFLPASYFPPSPPPSLPSYPTSFSGLSSYCPLGQAWGNKIRPCEWGCSLSSPPLLFYRFSASFSSSLLPALCTCMSHFVMSICFFLGNPSHWWQILNPI